MTYTTVELIQILDRELQAHWKGERILLSSANKIDNPVIAKAINLDKVGKVFAYQDFRRQIHQYQKEHQVSGIVWRVARFRDLSIPFPEIHNQLIPIEGDKQILIDAKESILSFWWQVTQDLKLWLLGDRHQEITADYGRKLAKQTEWAEIETALTEVYLGLCWGNPQEYQYKWAKPASGCYRLLATNTQPGLIKF